MRPLIVGEASRGGRPFEGRGSGERLRSLTGSAYLGRDFDLVNLLQDWPGRSGKKGDAFPIEEARAAARMLLEIGPHETIVCAGRRVAVAFGLGQLPWLSWQQRGFRRLGVIPHPSGLVRTWNDPEFCREARSFLREARRPLRWRATG